MQGLRNTYNTLLLNSFILQPPLLLLVQDFLFTFAPFFSLLSTSSDRILIPQPARSPHLFIAISLSVSTVFV